MTENPKTNDVPSPISGKGGWPWTEHPSEFPDTMPNGNPWPWITIVTPSFNQGKFIEETIRSVLCQGYPFLEYILIDACSTDETASIINYYRPCFSRIIVEPDRGQVDAIKKGLDLASGEWFNWLNSDDILLPNALKMLAIIGSLEPDVNWISGTRLILDPYSAPVGHEGRWITAPRVLGTGIPDFPQDATFIKTGWLRQNNELVEEIRNVFDTLLYLRLCKHSLPLFTTACFSAIRVHSEQKTADSATRGEEYRRWIETELKNLPLLSRLLVWASRIPGLYRIINFVLAVSVSKGLIKNSRKSLAATYDHRDLKWKIVPASSIVTY
jgi:glycosyltransferase involved in cell wall biosynthesis